MADIESPFIALGRQWVVENYPYNRTHLLKSLDWLDRIAPGAPEAVRIATLTHDMERAFGGPDAIPIVMNDRAYEKAHSDRSARIVGEWLRENGGPAGLVEDVEDLIRVHEWGGWPDANLVQAADSLSFLETNIDLMISFVANGKYPFAVIDAKIDEMYHRIQLPDARELARPMWVQAKAKLGSDPRTGTPAERDTQPVGSDPGTSTSTSTGVRPQYCRPESLDALFGILREHPDARILAGGTDLIVRLRKGHDQPRVLVDLKRVGDLRTDITQVGAAARIGARAVITDVIASALLRQSFPALIEAALVVGSVQIRNRATISGNLCNASPAADTAPALLAFGASVNLASAAGPRTLPLDQFFVGPGRTVLRPGEIVASVDIPLPADPTGSAFSRLTRRRGVDLAIASVCCVVHESGSVRLGFGAVGPRPFSVDTRNDSPLEDALAQASPIADLRASDEYRRAMLPVLTRRALKIAIERLRSARIGA